MAGSVSSLEGFSPSSHSGETNNHGAGRGGGGGRGLGRDAGGYEEEEVEGEIPWVLIPITGRSFCQVTFLIYSAGDEEQSLSLNSVCRSVFREVHPERQEHPSGPSLPALHHGNQRLHDTQASGEEPRLVP